MLTRKGFFSWARIYRSFMTDLTLRFVMIRALLISFMAKNYLAFLRSTRQTFPKPPLPMQLWYTKFYLETAAYKDNDQVHCLLKLRSTLYLIATLMILRFICFNFRSNVIIDLTLEVIRVEV